MTQAPSIEAELEALEADFAFLSDWEERYRHVIELGRALPRLAPEERVDANKVRGCASQVWLIAEPGLGGVLRFRGESDAHIVQGLVALALRVYSDRRPKDILALDPASLMRRLGLDEALTPQRSNGLAALVARIRAEAEAALA